MSAPCPENGPPPDPPVAFGHGLPHSGQAPQDGGAGRVLVASEVGGDLGIEVVLRVEQRGRDGVGIGGGKRSRSCVAAWP